MNRLFKLLVVPFLVLFLFAGGAIAKNITIWDGIVATGDSRPADDGEKGEVEPGMQTGQEWWLESFELNVNNLSTTGYFNFKNGFGGEVAGDIFVAVGGAPEYGTGADDGVLNFGYDYVFDVDWNSGTYSLFQLDPNQRADLSPQTTDNYPRSDPFNFNPLVDGNGKYSNGVTKVEDGGFSITGNNLYTASGFDMSFLEPKQEFWAHLTLSCGNDSMMGLGATHAPEPTTMLLLGTGLIGLAGVGRKKSKK